MLSQWWIKSAELKLYRLEKIKDSSGTDVITESAEPVKTIFDNATLSVNRDVSTSNRNTEVTGGTPEVI